jgi:hypothetical protein
MLIKEESIMTRERACKELFHLWGYAYMSGSPEAKQRAKMMEKEYSLILSPREMRTIREWGYSDNYEAYVGGLSGYTENDMLRDVICA